MRIVVFEHALYKIASRLPTNFQRYQLTTYSNTQANMICMNVCPPLLPEMVTDANNGSDRVFHPPATLAHRLNEL